MDQPPLIQPTSEVRYAQEQNKLAKRRDEERRKNLAAEMRRRTTQTSQPKK